MTPRITSRALLAGAACLVPVVVALGNPGTAQAATHTCGGQEATIVGTVRADFLTGTSGPDVVYLGYGNDRFDGLGGDDVICGGGSKDTITGGEGDDTLYGEEGDDTLTAGVGDDTVISGAGRDKVFDGSGDDTLLGGPGTDLLSYYTAGRYATTGVRLDAPGGTATGYGSDTLSGFEKFDLTRNTDVFRGRDVSEVVNSLGGDDTITTAGGNDLVWVGTGAVRVSTGAGDDFAGGQGNRATRVSLGDGDDGGGFDVAAVVSGGDGDDYFRTYLPGSRLEGGPGSDTVQGGYGRDKKSGVVIDLTTQTAHVIGARALWDLGSIENALGSQYDDVIYGTSGDNVLRGLEGDDRIEGRGGNDTLDGGRGDNTIVR